MRRNARLMPPMQRMARLKPPLHFWECRFGGYEGKIRRKCKTNTIYNRQNAKKYKGRREFVSQF
jgi:hypothetical protein